MSKKVKAVKCPQCKSTKNTLVGEDKYKCEHCSAEFILDNDDVNVYINHHRPHRQEDTPVNYKTPIIGFLMGLLTIVIVLVIVFSTKQAGQPATTATTPKAEKFDIIEGTGIIISNEASVKPIYIVLAKQMDKRKTEVLSYQMLVYDILANKQVKRTQLEAGTKIGIRSMFSEEDIYLISGMKTLYRLNPATFDLNNISDEFRTSYTQFSSGISSIDFSPVKGGLVVITNEGKTYTVFPEQKQLFTPTELAQFKSSKPVSPAPDEQLIVKTDGAVLLYTDGQMDLLNYKNPSENDFIIEYRDINTKETKWVVHVPSKIEQVKPYNDGFVLIDNMNKLMVVKKDGKGERFEL